MLCPTKNHKNGCNCKKLQREYGTRLFKCDRPGCAFFRTGFESRKDRDHHVNTHSRPFKCDTENCAFAGLGFATNSSLNVHKKKFHSHIDQTLISVISTDNTPELELVLIDAVKTNDVDCIRKLWSEVPKFLRNLLKICIEYSSSEMLRLLLKASSDINQTDPLLVNKAAMLNKPQLLQILLEHGCLLSDKILDPRMTDLELAIIHRSPEMIQSLLAHGAGDYPRGLPGLIPDNEGLQAEERAVQCFTLLKEHITTNRT